MVSFLSKLYSGFGRLIRMSVPSVIFVLGPPGSGKGTQCIKIFENFGFVHLSAGELLRNERGKPDSPYTELIESYIREGRIVPVEITCSLLEKAMKSSGCTKFLVDGFPRNQDNLDGWNRMLADKVHLLCVLYFDCPQDICIKRCLNRGAEGSGRTDDNIESLKKRFNTYVNETKPIINTYSELNLVKSIDATKPAEDVFADVTHALQDVI